MQEYKVTNENVGVRLDMFVLNIHPDSTRSNIKHRVEDGVILVNGNIVKAGYSLKLNDVVSIGDIEVKPMEATAEDIPLDIVYEDKDLAVINKPQGMVVHPAVGNRTGTLVNGLLGSLDNLSGINGVLRPGIVHRIDKDTSGLLVVAKNDFSHANLSQQIATKECRRIYVALLEGRLKESEGEVINNIGRDKKNRLKMAVVSAKEGKMAHTKYKVLQYYKGYTLVEFELKTGRTHQIRVHMKHIGFPLIGDFLYNPDMEYIQRQALHSYRLSFEHPITGKMMEFVAPLPEDMKKVMERENWKWI